jgi:hypothetical protein
MTPEEQELLAQHRFDSTADKLTPAGMPVVPLQSEATLDAPRLGTLSRDPVTGEPLPDPNPHLSDSRPVFDFGKDLPRPSPEVLMGDGPGHDPRLNSTIGLSDKQPTLKQQMKAAAQTVEPRATKPEKCKRLILEMLEQGPRETVQLKRALAAHEIGPRIMLDCLRALKVRTRRSGNGEVWYELPKATAAMPDPRSSALKSTLDRMGPMPEVLPERSEPAPASKSMKGREMLVSLPDYMTTEREECERRIADAYRRVQTYAVAMADYYDAPSQTRCGFCNKPVNQEQAAARLVEKNPRTQQFQNVFFDTQTCYILYHERTQRESGGEDYPGSAFTSRERDGQ